MFKIISTIGVTASLTTGSAFPVQADNQMGYRLLSPQEAQELPRNHGALGLDIQVAQQITDGGMTFDLLRVKQVRSGLAGEQAGFHPGDEIIAINGDVFPSLAVFAAYVGSTQPGSQMSVDYIPVGGGPQQAQRVAVTVGSAGQPAAQVPQNNPTPSTGMSTGTKVAIGLGAAALFGCYELGCSLHHHRSAPSPSRQAPMQNHAPQQ